MSTINLPSTVVKRRLVNWTKVSEGEWKSGNVRIIRDEDQYDPDHPCPSVTERWYVKVSKRGRWRWCYCESRPWGYGSASQAKRGVSIWGEALEYQQ